MDVSNTVESTASVETSLDFSSVGRNDTCPCGSGKKFKRCHSEKVEAEKMAAKAAPATPSADAAGSAAAEGVTPNAGGMPDMGQMNPEMMQQVMTMMRRMPKNQLMQMQAMMQRAMKGEDITREAQELERRLPKNLRDFFTVMQMSATMMNGGAGGVSGDATGEGSASSLASNPLLATPAEETTTSDSAGTSKVGGFFKGLFAKKS